MKEIAYSYHNLPIPGGGYVTGFLFHPENENILYIRTDIGGCYRFDYDSQTWCSLCEAVSMYDLSETFPIAMAADPKKPEALFIASGVNRSNELDPDGNYWGKLSISMDRGRTFEHRRIPYYVHGNLNGRGSGYRLVKDPVRENTLYFASQRDGLLCTRDMGLTWQRLKTGEEGHMTFVWCSPDGNTLIAGTAGVDTGSLSGYRGHSLYVSYDGGESFQKLMMPESITVPGSKWSGYVAERYDYDGQYFYCTLCNTGARSYVTEMGYSCDSGDVLGGRILRYSFDGAGRITGYQDITPSFVKAEDGGPVMKESASDVVYDFGFGGISSCRSCPGLLAASTLCRDEGDIIFISKDHGDSWEPALFDLSIGNLHFETPYMKPEYNGGHSLIHWLSDVKINPFDPDEVWFNSGTGVFRGTDFTSSDRSFCDCCNGLEETVHLNVYSPIEGPVAVIDILGDLGGFAFEDVDKPCENSFADQEGNRYITCINADSPDLQPEIVVVTPRGNWTGKTKGGLILSRDYGLTFERLALPYGISDYLDERFRQIERPNVNSGWIAVSSDASSLVYCVAEGNDLYMKGIVVSQDQGKSFQKAVILDTEGMDISDSDLHLKVFSDRINPQYFYGFGDDLKLFISIDKGSTFRQLADIPAMEGLELGLIDCANGTEIRGETGKEGVFFAALGQEGLLRITFRPADGEAVIERLTKEEDVVYRVGLGLLSPDSDYRKDDKALYICGVIQGVYGFFRSLDQGKTWDKINNDRQQFGDINSIAGDSRQFGRYFIATGSLGLKYGVPADQ